MLLRLDVRKDRHLCWSQVLLTYSGCKNWKVSTVSFNRNIFSYGCSRAERTGFSSSATFAQCLAIVIVKLGWTAHSTHVAHALHRTGNQSITTLLLSCPPPLTLTQWSRKNQREGQCFQQWHTACLWFLKGIGIRDNPGCTLIRAPV